ncbi:hypothetical protein Ciccas_005275, partial [Cichlidogyrus casuarinus]
EGTSLSLKAWRPNDQCKLEPDQELLAVLPGSGWDNLMNHERPQVVDREDYSQCKLSTDRKFVVPDQMEIEPIKMTETSFSSETFEDSYEYVDSTSNTINADSGLSFFTSSISGSYSWEKVDVRKKQSSSKSIVLRNQVRHRLYKVFLGPEAPLHKHFKKRILSISYLLDSPKIDISLLEDISKIDDYWLEQPEIVGTSRMLRSSVNPIANLSTSTPYVKAVEAAYLADMMIRDFGTHFITETENGAAIIQISYLNEKVRKMSQESRTSISKGASVAFSFGLKFNLDYRSEEKNSKINMENYMNVMESRFQTTYGGAPVTFGENSFDEWQKSVRQNMVAVDRVGRPIYEAVSESKLPELKPSLIAKIVEVLKSAVHRYYKANIVLGCLDHKSPLFDPNANTPSNAACSVSEASFFKKGQTFGGTYQYCLGPHELCKIHGRENPLTGEYSCPSDYTPVRLLPTQVIGCVTRVDRGWFWNSYNEVCAETDAFWCSPRPGLDGKISDAYYFGGIFSDTSVNPVTGEKSCPDKFHSFRLGKSLNLCGSVSWDIAVLTSVPFGGLYACQSGNPMTPLIEKSLKQAPKRCPSGYVTHSAGLEDVCQISYCMPSDTFQKVKARLIHSPPFIKLVSAEEKIPKSYMQAMDGTLLELHTDGVLKKAETPHRKTIIILLLLSLLLIQKGTSLSLPSRNRNDQCVLEPDQELLAVLPGSGWDNLLNEERPQVIDRNHYSQCKLSTDRKFLVPDQMDIKPIKMTVTSFSSKMFESSSEYVDSTSNMINVNSGLLFGDSSISGSYSWERTNVRTKQLSSKSIVLRNQVRHRLYKVFLGPEAPLHKHFKKRILSISYLLHSPKVDISKIDEYWLDKPGIPANGEMLRSSVNSIANLSTSTPYMKAVEAAYLADLIIRDFGTHFITETENGAAIIQISYLKKKVRKMSKESRSSISKGASVAFSLGLKFNLDYRSEEKNSQINMENYMNVVESRFQTTYGGAPVTFGENSFDEWQRSVRQNMVAVDRVGRPIYEAVSASKLPELEPTLIAKIVEVLKSAVHRYYEANIVLGCLDPKSPLFDPNANTPSSTACNVSEASFYKKGQIFGGTFQKCNGLYESYNFCKSHGHKHPLTGGYSCPSGYTPVRLLPTKVIGCATEVDRGFLWNSYHKFCAQSDAFWCSPSVLDGEISDAYFFGGIFSDTSVNPVTGDKSCPNNFHLFRLGKGLNLCGSVDYQIALPRSVPFGGLYACQSGNPMTPLIEKYKNPLNKSGNVESTLLTPSKRVLKDALQTTLLIRPVWKTVVKFPIACPVTLSKNQSQINPKPAFHQIGIDRRENTQMVYAGNGWYTF